MSWDVSLCDAFDSPVSVDRHEEGGTYVMGGTDTAELNITYNYSEHYNLLDKEQGLDYLDGKKAGECIDRLEIAVAELGTTRDPDYWSPTKGNAGYALSILLRWAKQYPDAVFEVH